MDDVDLRRGEEQQCRTQLLSKLACQIKRDPMEVGVVKQFVEIVGEEFKYQAEVVAEHEVTFQAHCVLGGGERGRVCGDWVSWSVP